jgi:aspartyl protease family protein
VVVFSLGRIAVVACVSAATTAGAMTLWAPQPLRMARLDAEGFAPSHPTPGSGAVAKGADGHFWADAEVNGQSVHFLVDTGATAVALTPKDAARLGIRPEDMKPGYSVTTAGGSTKAAAVVLASVSVNGARLDNVQALVVSDGLDVSLLGMSYLGRLTRFEATRDTLRFQP